MRERIERKLEALGYDAMECNFSSVLSLSAPPAGPYEEILIELDAARAAEPGAGWPLAFKGKALANLGRYEEARGELTRSLALEPDSGLTRAWLGSVELLSGRYAEALRELDRALESGAGRSWARFYRAAGLFASGEEEKGGSELRLIDKSNVEAWLAGAAFRVLLAIRAGDFDAGLKTLAPLLRARPNAGWGYALRARLRKGQGDKAACLRDFETALKLSPSSWIYLERSRVYEELGDLLRSLDDVDAAVALDGPSAACSLRRGHLQVCRRHYHLAIPEYTEALRLDPACREAYLERASVHCIREDFDAAIADMASAEKMSGGDPSLTLERLRMAIYAGKTEGVSRELEAVAARDSALLLQSRFLAGCLSLKTRSYARAAEEFGDAISPAGDSDHDQKTAFYRVIARGLSAPGGRTFAPAAAARLHICGLGIKPPYTAGLETLRAILACDFIFNNLSEPEIAGMLRLLSREGRPTMFDVRGADARWTKTIFREIRPGRTVGFVTRGHPLVCGGLAFSLMEECRRRGVEWELFGSVSSMDTLAIETADGRGGRYWGQQVLDYSAVFSEHFSLDARLPTVVYFNATAMELSKKDHLRFCATLEKSYSRSQPCYFYGRSFHVKPDVIALAELRDRHGKIDPSFTLLIPPKRARA